MINLFEAIVKLHPQVTTLRGDTAYDSEGNAVTYDLTAVEAEIQANAYKAQRAAEYPSYADQFDTIFHEGLDAWKAQIQAVKNKYPKGA